MPENELRLHRCCFTGHRPEKLRFSESEICSLLDEEIKNAIEAGYTTFISGMGEYEIPDERSNPEEMVVQNLAMDRLRQCLDELPAEDREFLFALFEGKYGYETALAKEMGIPRTTLQRRKERLVEALRQKFFEKF